MGPVAMENGAWALVRVLAFKQSLLVLISFEQYWLGS